MEKKTKFQWIIKTEGYGGWVKSGEGWIRSDIGRTERTEEVEKDGSKGRTERGMSIRRTNREG